MDRLKLGLNTLVVIGILVIVIFALSVIFAGRQIEVRDYPEISSKSPSRGEKGAPVTIIEFGDFQCPYCKELAGLFKQIETEYGSRVRFVWKDFPLDDIHINSLMAAEVARCAGDQDKFWEMHDQLFENQVNLSDEIYVSLAERIGLDQNKFIDCVSNHKKLSLVEKDVEEGLKLGVVGTPHFYVNQYVITELITIEQLKMLIESELIK